MMSYRGYGMVALAALLIAVYTLSHASKFHVVDEVSLFAVTESLALRGEVDTNAIAWTQWVNSPGEVLGAFGPNGEVYSKKGPAPAFLATLWYLLLRGLARLDVGVGVLQATLLWNGFVTAATALLLWGTALRLGYGERAGAGLGLLFGLCTIAWPYANQFFGEPLSAFALLLCFYGLIAWTRTGKIAWTVVAGTGAGLALATVTAHAIGVAILAAYGVAAAWSSDRLRKSRGAGAWVGAVVGFAAPLVGAAALLLWYNQMRFGDPFSTGYHFDSGEGFTTPLAKGLWGLLVSPYRGVFWFTPLFLGSLATLPAFFRKHRLEAVATGVLSLAFLGLYSLWWMWWAGFAWGPRFLVPLTPFWVLWLAPWVAQTATAIRGGPHASAGSNRTGPLERWRHVPARAWGLILLAVISFVVQLSAVTVNWVNFEIKLRSLYPTDWADPLLYGPPAQSLRDFLDGPVFGQWRLMRENLVANTDLAWLWSDGNVQVLLVLVGMAVLMSTAVAFFAWWWAPGDEGDPRALPSAPVQWLLPLLPVFLIAVWMGEVSRNPHYGDPERGYRAIVSELCQHARQGDALITVAPYAYQIPMNWMGAECAYGLPVFGYAPNSMEFAEANQVLEDVLERYGRVWLVTGGVPANDPENSVERWLADRAFKANDQWYDDFRVLDYGTAQTLEAAPLTPLNVTLVGEGTSQITLTSARVPTLTQAGNVLPVEIGYRLQDANIFDLRWFVQLLRPEGFPAALLDTGPADGYVQFSELPPNQDLVERAGLLLPENLPSGRYEVIAGLYNPATSDAGRLRAADGRDFVQLGSVLVE